MSAPSVSVSSVIILTISNTTVIEGEAALAVGSYNLAAIEAHVCFDGRTAVAQIGQVQHDKDEDQEFHIVKIIELIQLILHFYNQTASMFNVIKVAIVERRYFFLSNLYLKQKHFFFFCFETFL